MSEKIFKKFNDLIFQVMSQFFIWRRLHRTEYKSAYDARGYFWAPVITTLQHAFLLNLANIFDEKDKRVLSVFTFLEELKDRIKKQKLIDLIHSAKYGNAIKRLSQWRNNMLAHKNVHFVLNPKELTARFPFTGEEIENLLELLTQILNQTAKDFDPRHPADYSAHYRIVDEGCRKHTDFVLENGLYTEAYKKIKKQKE